MARRGSAASGSTSRDASTREHILQTALDSFSLHGFEGSSTRSIAAAAGVNQGLIPYYFGTKQALWREAVDRAFEELHASVGDFFGASEAKPSRNDVAYLVRRYVEFVAAHPEFVLMMNEEGKRQGPRMRWIVDRHVKPLFEGLTSFFEEAGSEMRVPGHVDPVHINYIFIGAVAAIFHQTPECRRVAGYDPMLPALIEAHADALVHLFLGDSSLGKPS